MRSESDEMAAGAGVVAIDAAETREGVGVGDGVPTVLYVEGLFRYGLGVWWDGSGWLVGVLGMTVGLVILWLCVCTHMRAYLYTYK